MEMRNHLLIGIAALMCMGSAPSRTQTYVAGQIIQPDEVTENEDNIFQYLQSGVDTYRSGTVDTTAIANGTIANVDISGSAAIDFSKLATLTSGRLIIGSAGGVPTSTAVTGDVTISSTGVTAIGSGKVTSTMILDNTITTSDLNGTLTFADGDLVDLASINTSGTGEGLKLPQNTSCASGTAEGQICWDTDDDKLFIGNSASALDIIPVAAIGAATNATLTNTTYASIRTVAVGTSDGIVIFPISAVMSGATGGAGSSWILQVQDNGGTGIQAEFVGLKVTGTTFTGETATGTALTFTVGATDNFRYVGTIVCRTTGTAGTYTLKGKYGDVNMTNITVYAAGAYSR